MTWTNAFDVGECVVKVTTGNDVDLFEGILAKGDGADFNDSTGDHLPMRVDVDSDGNVSLTSAYTIDSFGFTSVALRVIPSESLGSLGIRVSGLVGDSISTNNAALAQLVDGAPVDSVALTLTGTNLTPDPAVLTTLPARSELSIYSERT